MPVDDALRLIEQNFEEYVKKARQRNIREVVPREIRNLLLDLLETRPLSMGDLDKLIKYLKERQSMLVDDQIEQKRETAAGEATLYSCRIVKTYSNFYQRYNLLDGLQRTFPGDRTPFLSGLSYFVIFHTVCIFLGCLIAPNIFGYLPDPFIYTGLQGLLVYKCAVSDFSGIPYCQYMILIYSGISSSQTLNTCLETLMHFSTSFCSQVEVKYCKGGCCGLTVHSCKY